MGTQKEMEHEDATCKYQMNDIEDQVKNNPQDFLAASGLEDSDAEDNAVISLSLSLNFPYPVARVIIYGGCLAELHIIDPLLVFLVGKHCIL